MTVCLPNIVTMAIYHKIVISWPNTHTYREGKRGTDDRFKLFYQYLADLRILVSTLTILIPLLILLEYFRWRSVNRSVLQNLYYRFCSADRDSCVTPAWWFPIVKSFHSSSQFSLSWFSLSWQCSVIFKVRYSSFSLPFVSPDSLNAISKFIIISYFISHHSRQSWLRLFQLSY